MGRTSGLRQPEVSRQHAPEHPHASRKALQEPAPRPGCTEGPDAPGSWADDEIRSKAVARE